jgi:hypothetical protein
MKPFILQDWLTVRSTGTPPAPAGPNFVQDAAGWLDLSAFQDVVIWFDLRNTSVLTNCVLFWDFQTAPTKDDVLFQAMVSSGGWGNAARSLVVLPATLAAAIAGGTVPLSTWLRWQIRPGGSSPNQAWSATFRVIVAANQVIRGATDAGQSTALQSALASMPAFAKKKVLTTPSGSVSIAQTATPMSLGQGPSAQSATSLVQPAMGVGGLGGLGQIGP